MTQAAGRAAQTHSSPPAPVASVVIPAYQEGNVVGRCLRALTAPGAPPLEIVVAANGCTDDTVANARAVPGVAVLDLPAPGKSGALNAGDAAVGTFPRIFLDADVTLGPGALQALVAALAEPGTLGFGVHFADRQLGRVVDGRWEPVA